jgi:hypothetical protein
MNNMYCLYELSFLLMMKVCPLQPSSEDRYTQK